jgi:hypothetical protein
VAIPGLTGGLVAVGAVIVVALLMRAMAGKGQEAGSVPTMPAPVPVPEPEPVDSVAEALADEDEEMKDDGLVVAISSSGSAFVPDRYSVVMLAPEEEGEQWKVGSRIESGLLMKRTPNAIWQSGDLRGVRVVRGEFEEGPWVLETLGRDGEFVTFSFETREPAEAAKALFEKQGIVQLGEDEDGRPMPPSAEQFEEAKRIVRETEAALDLPEELPSPLDDRDERREGTP